MQTPVAKDDGDAPQDTVRRLEAEIARLRASRERLVVAAESERRVLERELHRGVQQQLVALAVVLQLAEEALGTDPAQTRRRLGDARSVVQQAVDDAARLAQRIHPPLLETGGLGVAVRVTKHTGLAFDVTGSQSELAERTYEGPTISFAPPGSTREEIERLAIWYRRRLTYRPQMGISGAFTAGGQL